MIMFKIIFERGANISPMADITNKTMLVDVNILMKLSVAAIIRSIADMSSSVYICIPFTKIISHIVGLVDDIIILRRGFL